MNKNKDVTTNDNIGELIRIVNNHLNPIVMSPTLSAAHTYTPPLMGTSARAAKRRIDGDTGPVRIEGTDTYNQQLQHHYQNVQQILGDEYPNKISNFDQSNMSKQSFNTKRDLFEQRYKSSTYDSPPREQQPSIQQIITTITTSPTVPPPPPPDLLHHGNSSLNKSLTSSDPLLEHTTDVQKSPKTDSQHPFRIEHTEQYEVFLDSTNNETRRTPSVSRTTISHVTDFDRAQTQGDSLTDDHQAIQKLTRALQEHNVSTTNEYKRLPSRPNSILINTTTTTTTTTIPSNITRKDSINKPITSDFAVIDALLNNPIGTNNVQQNKILHRRFNNILSDLKNSEYVNLLKQSILKEKEKKKPKKSKNKNVKKSLVDKQTQLPESNIESILMTSNQTSLANTIENKEQDKENKKKSKIKSKQLSKDADYQVIDTIINSPISLRLPNSYLTKYKFTPPTSQLSTNPSIISTDNNISLPTRQLETKVRNETDYNLVKVVNELMLHHAAALVATVTTTTTKEFQQPFKINNQNEIFNQQHSLTHSNPFDTQLQGNSYKNTQLTYIHDQQIPIDDQRHHIIPAREQHTIWQDESKMPTTIKREDLEIQDKRIPKLSEQSSPLVRAIPVFIEHEQITRIPYQEQQPQQRRYHYSNEQNIPLNWSPSPYQLEQKYIPSGTVLCDTDSTTSEPSGTFPSHDHTPVDTYYHYDNRPLYQDNIHYHNRSPTRPYYHSQTGFPSSDSRGKLHEYIGNNISRNYIEVFRDGETKPSEIYSVPFNESIPTNSHRSRYDQYQSEKHKKTHTLPYSSNSKHEKNIPSSSSTSHYPHTVQSSPNRDDMYFDNYLRQSKSFDYRPLRTKLQREYKITPSLLVDEWDYPQQTILNNYTKQTSSSSPDDVFINNNYQKSNHDTNGNHEQHTRINHNDSIDSNRIKQEHNTQIRLNSQPIYRALALHSFYAQTNRELSFKKGDIILVLRRINDDWLEGEYQGSIGIFPLNHVELFPIETNEQENYLNDYIKEHESEGEAIVKYDFMPQKTFELQLRKGDKVILLRRLDNNWYEGRLNHIEGIFPAAYVETLREPPELFSKKSHQNEYVHSSKQTSPDIEQVPIRKIDIIPDLSLPMRKCQVLYDYKPQNPDELEIHVGDIINIIEMCDDGWYCGVMEKSDNKNTMEFGTFPGNYVKLL